MPTNPPAKQELRSKVTDTLKDHALKLVANAHSEMSDEQFLNYCNELTPQFADALIHLFEQYAEGAVKQTEKAYGGCHKCYGKGYATVRKQTNGYATDGDIGGLEGPVRGAPHTDMKFCTCERGKQLEAYAEGVERRAEDAVIAIAHRKPCDCGSNEHFPTPVRSVTGAVTYYCQFSRVVPSAPTVTQEQEQHDGDS